jgi:hypothetical protein
MNRVIAALALSFLAFSGTAAFAGAAEELRALYERFLAAQNTHDITAVRRHLLDGPRFLLWVSDGKSFWGRDAMLERTASFQEAEVWRVDPTSNRRSRSRSAPRRAISIFRPS